MSAPAPTSAPAAACAHTRRVPLWAGLLSRCADCGLVATARLPAFDYDADYFREDGTGYDFASVFARCFDAARFVPELQRLEESGLRGTILDVGCAIGTFLGHAKQRGWAIAGVELAEFARNEATQRLAVPVAASLDALPAGVRFDVVTLHHVLEHVADPVAFLAHDVAPRVGRLLLIEVPNFASFAAQTEGPRWKDLRPEQHVHHFEPGTLRHVVETAGFDVHAVRTLVDPLWSLHQARRLVASLRALRGEVVHGDDSPAPDAAERAAAMRVWRPPSGTRAIATETSRVALRPLARWIERSRRAERLVIEAEPRRDGH